MIDGVKLMSTSKNRVILLSLHHQITVLFKSYVITNADTAVKKSAKLAESLALVHCNTITSTMNRHNTDLYKK